MILSSVSLKDLRATNILNLKHSACRPDTELPNFRSNTALHVSTNFGYDNDTEEIECLVDLSPIFSHKSMAVWTAMGDILEKI